MSKHIVDMDMDYIRNNRVEIVGRMVRILIEDIIDRFNDNAEFINSNKMISVNSGVNGEDRFFINVEVMDECR